MYRYARPAMHPGPEELLAALLAARLTIAIPRVARKAYENVYKCVICFGARAVQRTWKVTDVGNGPWLTMIIVE